MFKSQSPPAMRPPSKEGILKQVDELRGLARRARRQLGNAIEEEDRQRLVRYVHELEASAARLEKAAIDAKSG